MFALCSFLSNPEEKFVLFDEGKDLSELAEGMNVKIEKEISFNELKEEYSLYNLGYVNDIILRMLRPKERTSTIILGELMLDSWFRLEQEYNKIQEKKSKLSKSQRDIVIEQYNKIINISNKQEDLTESK